MSAKLSRYVDGVYKYEPSQECIGNMSYSTKEVRANVLARYRQAAKEGDIEKIHELFDKHKPDFHKSDLKAEAQECIFEAAENGYPEASVVIYSQLRYFLLIQGDEALKIAEKTIKIGNTVLAEALLPQVKPYSRAHYDLLLFLDKEKEIDTLLEEERFAYSDLITRGIYYAMRTNNLEKFKKFLELDTSPKGLLRKTQFWNEVNASYEKPNFDPKIWELLNEKYSRHTRRRFPEYKIIADRGSLELLKNLLKKDEDLDKVLRIVHPRDLIEILNRRKEEAPEDGEKIDPILEILRPVGLFGAGE